MSKNYGIAQTQISPIIRVSSAVIHYDELWGERWQYETWIFSDAVWPATRQVIHGSSTYPHCEWHDAAARKYHRRVVRLIKGAFDA